MATNREYRVLLAADIERSAGRGDEALRKIRDVLRTALRESAERSGIDWDACLSRDTGDGMWLILPAGVQKTLLLHPLARELAALLQAHNRMAGPPAQVRVRLSLHAGDICLVPDGEPYGRPFEVTARMLDADPVKAALASSPGPLAVVVSQHFYEETVPHGYPGIEPENFRRVSLTVKEYTADAWLCLPHSGTPAAAPQDRSERPGRPERPEASKEVPGRSVQINKAKENGTVYATQHGSQHIYVTEDR